MGGSGWGQHSRRTRLHLAYQPEGRPCVAHFTEQLMKQQLNIAMIGSGFMGDAHSNAFCQVGHFFPTKFEMRRKVICARDRTRLEAKASRWGWDEIATDWEAVVSRPDIDVVDVATTNAMHAPIAIAAAQAGKIVLCEKPLAISLEEARRMAEA